jgi:mono/diheme cytochrome c family protein
MQRLGRSSRRNKSAALALMMATTMGWLGVSASRADLPGGAVTPEQVLRGRGLVVSHDCGGCHSTGANGSNPGQGFWLSGLHDEADAFQIGPFRTLPRNLTPDNLTGTGRLTERQIFNALRYGLDPEDTPDVAITGNTPGQGNFPAVPHYLAPPMSWPSFRHMSDQELWDIAAYIKHGLKPVSNLVKDSDGPPDFWASAYTPARIGTYPLSAFPADGEVFTP